MNHVVLVHPQIGGNTGAIIRLASNLGFALHLVEPFGFEITDSRVKRAGLDYRELADVRQHPDWAAAAQATTGSRRLAFTAHAELHLHEVSIDPADVLVFGCEASGLPAEILAECVPVRIPMMPGNRSINLANAVAIAAYEAWRQHGFVGAAARVTNQPVPTESFTPFDTQVDTQVDAQVDATVDAQAGRNEEEGSNETVDTGSVHAPPCHSDGVTELVLTIIGRDRAGIVASLADVVRFHEGNWKRSELAEIAGTFAGVVVVEVGDDRVDELLTNLLVLRDQGVHVTAQQIEEPIEAPEAIPVHLRITGDDTPGVIHEISSRFGDLGISILRMRTVTDLTSGADAGGKKFEFTARLAVPVQIEVDAVLDAIDGLASILGIEVNVEDLTETDSV